MARLAERKEEARLKPEFLGCPKCGGPKSMRSALCRPCRRAVIGERAVEVAAQKAAGRREERRRGLDGVLADQEKLPGVRL